MKIEIKNLNQVELRKLGINNWPVWEKEISVFEWDYDQMEQFYVIEGSAIIKTNGKDYHLEPGNFVTCPKGLNCKWEIIEPLKKHYLFVDN